MLKREEMDDPNSCLNRANWDERIFVLLARDVAAPSTIRHWVSERIALGKNLIGDPQMVEALQFANLMEQERKTG